MFFVKTMFKNSAKFKKMTYTVSINLIGLSIISMILIYVGFKNYLLFHSAVEIFSSLIGFGILVIAINTYKNSKNNSFMILGIAYGFVGLLDIVHALAYKGMGVFYSSMPLVDIPTQLWISARYIEAISILIACILLRKSNKNLMPRVILGIYMVISWVLLLTIIHWRTFPQCLIEESGLTNFKIVSEYIISLILFLSIVFLFKAKNYMDLSVFTYMNLSLVATIISEIMFTLYSHPYGLFNMIGHIFKVLSFIFIYKSVIEIGLKNPYRLLSKQLKETSHDLERKNYELDNASRRLQVQNQQHKHMEQVLISNEQCYDLLIESSKEAIFVHTGGKIIFANEGLTKLLGAANLNDVIGRSVLDLFPKNLRNKINRMMEERYSGIRTRSSYETKLIQDTGNIIDVEADATYFSYKGIPATLTVVRDITEKKEVEKLKVDFEESRKRLNETLEFNKLITEFFSNISHELKTPLNVILGAVQVLKLYSKDDMPMYDMNKKYLRIMKQNCYRLLRLVNNLIDISKIDSGFFKLHLSNYNIVSIVEDITLSVADYVESRRVSLIFDTDIEEKMMACDPDKIERIMLNLLSNAIKFTNPGDKIIVNMVDKEDHILISVKDTGIGIPEDKLQTIFERFRQIDKTIKRNREGSGIGLSLVKSLIELHEGDIKINSKLGEGSEFIIELPVKSLIDEDSKDSAVMYESKVERIDIEFSDIYA